MKNPTWKDLLNFINEEIKKDPSFLENEIMIECASINQVSKEGGWNTLSSKESDFVTPSWHINNQIHVLTTKFQNKKIVALNIFI